MPIIPWRPFRDIEEWLQEWWPEEWFEEFPLPRIRTPRMNVYEEDNNVVVEAELPGVKPEDIDIEVKENQLKIEAKREEKKEEKEKGYWRKELRAAHFKRIIPLPIEVVGEKAEASFEDGILKITIPKKELPKEKKGVKIKVKGK